MSCEVRFYRDRESFKSLMPHIYSAEPTPAATMNFSHQLFYVAKVEVLYQTSNDS